MKKSGIELIAEERREQIEKHGYDLDHDLEHEPMDLARGACAIAYDSPGKDFPESLLAPNWAWDIREEKGLNTLERLKVAGALIAAEIDRLQAEQE